MINTLWLNCLQKVNIPSAKTIRITDDVDLYELDYPLIAKPSKNAGSCFVKKVNTPAELQEIACIISKMIRNSAWVPIKE